MASTNRFILKTIALGLVVTWLVINAAHIEFLARQHMMHFESRLGGACSCSPRWLCCWRVLCSPGFCLWTLRWIL